MTRLDLYLALALYAAVLACTAVPHKPELTPVCAQACAEPGADCDVCLAGPED